MEMWNEVLSTVVSNGIFAVLFVWLFFYQMRDSSKREEKYQQTIETLTNNLSTLEDVKQELLDIKEYLKDEDDYEESAWKNEIV